MVKTSEMSMELKQELAFTKEELAELEAAKKMPITFDADCPETTPERAVKFRRVNPPRNRMDGDIEKVVSEEKIRQLSRSIIDNICTFCAKALFLELCVYYKTLAGKLHPRTC